MFNILLYLTTNNLVCYTFRFYFYCHYVHKKFMISKVKIMKWQRIVTAFIKLCLSIISLYIEI